MVENIRDSSHFLIMQKFDEYITEERIILSLCKIRAKYANQRCKRHLIHLLSSNEDFNYHLNTKKKKTEIDSELELLNNLLPSRRKWKKLNKKNRYKKNNQRINSVDYNIKSLLVTIDYYKKHNPNEPFLLNLNAFILDLRASVKDPNYTIKSPKIIPKLRKDKKSSENVCRPISLFTLKDRLIISFTNKYFTEIFDKYFYSKSYAFRAVQIKGNEKSHLTHHDAIQSILDYKKRYKGKRLWISECDIRKFYDSVHHKIVKKVFKTLINRVKKDSPDLYDIRAERIFYKFLDSYSFVKDVLPFNEKRNKWYWDDRNIPDGSYGWVKNKLLELGYFKSFKNAKIGVPQGGALSGLIANIVLNVADQRVIKSSNLRLLYVRFCDDMVIIHPSKKECKKASQVYFETLKELHLISHDFKSNLKNSPDSFWNSNVKSKHPYKWSSNYKDSFHWFGFVGYEIHYTGDLRVRKSSLNKEKKKQREVVSQIINAIKKGKRKNDGTIFESAVNRLIGMSVGRLNLTNFHCIDHEMCWVSGFIKLNDNKHLRAQLKDLDRYRAKQLSILLETIKGIEIKNLKLSRIKIGKLAFAIINGFLERDSEVVRNQLVSSGILNNSYQLINGINLKDESLDLGLTGEYKKYRNEIIEILKHPTDNRKVVYYGKPFSYYYQIIERMNRN
jgi:hypothetical protein